MEEICSLCEGSGLRIVEEGGRQVARACECRVARRAARMLEQAQIPRRYEECTLENFEPKYDGADRSLQSALVQARGFVKGYPVETDGKGLLLVGPVGVGKTHIAVGILKELVQERGAHGLFYDYRELLKEVQNSYNQKVAATELEVLRPVFEAEVLVLDELGAAKPSDWVWDTVAHILNSRYNDRRTTIITTNFQNFEEITKTELRNLTDIQKAAREETLGDRIGERMRSRLQEMCVAVEMYGEDYRQLKKRASFAIGPKGASATPALRSAAEALRSAAEALQSAAEEDIPSISKAIQDAAPEGFIAQRPRIDECVAAPEPEQEKPLVGRARMGRWASPCPKRLNEND